MKVTCFCTTHTYTWLHNVCVVGGAAATAESAISKMKCTQQNCKNIHIFVIFGLWMSGRKKNVWYFCCYYYCYCRYLNKMHAKRRKSNGNQFVLIFSHIRLYQQPELVKIFNLVWLYVWQTTFCVCVFSKLLLSYAGQCENICLLVIKINQTLWYLSLCMPRRDTTTL